MADFNFTPGANQFNKVPTKKASSKFDRSKIRWNRVEDVLTTLTGSFMPTRFLDTKFIDVSTEHGIVIPMCSVVSIKSKPTSATNSSGYANKAELGLTGDDDGNDGMIAITNTVDNETLYVGAGDASYGYPDGLNGFITIANGGVNVQDTYSSYDEIIGSVGVDGSLVEAGDNCPTRTANIPAGIVLYDIWKDIRGLNLNYNQPTQLGSSVMTKGMLKVPFVKESYVEDYNAAYKKVSGKYPFLVMPDTGLTEGLKIMPDKYGKFVVYDSTSSVTVGEASDQIIGRYKFQDTDLPKTWLEYVDTYPGSRTAGMDTGGIGQALYDFIETILKANSENYTQSDIVNAIRSGDFGLAYLTIDIV